MAKKTNYREMYFTAQRLLGDEVNRRRSAEVAATLLEREVKRLESHSAQAVGDRGIALAESRASQSERDLARKNEEDIRREYAALVVRTDEAAKVAARETAETRLALRDAGLRIESLERALDEARGAVTRLVTRFHHADGVRVLDEPVTATRGS